jgi:hypothetical protein
MFTKIFDKFFQVKKSENKNTKISLNYIFDEVKNACILAYKKISPKDIVLVNFVFDATFNNKLKEVLENRLNTDINKQLFYIKEDFLKRILFNNFLFKKEWSTLYQRSTNPHTLWLFYTQRTLYVLGNNFYIRNKKINNLFNLKNVFTGKYENNYKKNSKNIYWGFLSFWKAIKIWSFSLIILSVSFYVLLIKRSCVLPQTLFFWVSFSMLLYWLLSGFVFFVKKYQFSRYTSVIQRFWRRTYILFWLIESGLLLVFFYLMINSSQESFYMFDQGYFLKTHLFSWKLFIFKCILVVSLITYSYLLLLNLKWSVFNKNIINLIILTTLLLYLVWTEFYQIYWVSNFYANFSWLYDVDESVWSLEFDGRRTRILNHYIMVLFLLKFWHIVFIFGCWVFFLLRANELDTITYPLYSFNFQNFIILFLMMWLFMYPWFRHTYHWISEIPYYWFYVDTHVSFYKILIIDAYNFYYNCILNIIKITTFDNFTQSSFLNWFFIDGVQDYNVFIKSTIKNEILKNLIQNK